MNTNRGSTEAPNQQIGVGIVDGVPLTRIRYIELVAIANKCCIELEKAGLKQHEYCEFGRLMEKMLRLE